MLSRVRQCNWCKANVRGYDHHCPAFGTCIGQKNHRLFMALLTGFVVAESTYTMCSTKYITRCINSGTLRSEVAISIYFLCAGIPKAISYAVFFLHWYWFWTCSAHLNKLVIHFLCKCVQPYSLVFFLLELFPLMFYPSSFSIFYYIGPMGASVCSNF